jgi:hypothetical protein
MIQSRLTKEYWQGFCKHVENIKREHWERDRVLPGHIDSIIKYLNPDSDSNDDTVYESSDTPSITVIDPHYLARLNHIPW